MMNLTPYYTDEYVTFYLGDALQVLPKLTNKVDLVFADPPFNVGKEYGGDAKGDLMTDMAYRDWCTRWIELCWNLISPIGSFYLMTMHHYLDWELPLMARYGVYINLIIWQSGNHSKPGRSRWGTYQPIMVYGKSNDFLSMRHEGEGTDLWSDIPAVTGGQSEAIRGDRGSRKKEHPCQMPQVLAERAIRFSTKRDMVVLDPFMGSGTVARAAKRLKRQFIGIERVERYCEMAVNSCLQETFDVEEVSDKVEQEKFF
jgi:site-specific DNA-methyltransferase (adenine-specific)